MLKYGLKCSIIFLQFEKVGNYGTKDSKSAFTMSKYVRETAGGRFSLCKDKFYEGKG